MKDPETNKELKGAYKDLDIVKDIKSQRLICAGHMLRVI